MDTISDSLMQLWLQKQQRIPLLVAVVAGMTVPLVLHCGRRRILNQKAAVRKKLRVGILGAGAIGMITGLRLSKCTKYVDHVVLVGRDSLKRAITQEQQQQAAIMNGRDETNNASITVKDHCKKKWRAPGKEEEETYPYKYEDGTNHAATGRRFEICFNDLSKLKGCDIIIVAVKTVDTKAVGIALAESLISNKNNNKQKISDSEEESSAMTTPIILSFQNGTRNAERLLEIFRQQGCEINNNSDIDDTQQQEAIEILTCVVAFSAEWEANSTIFHMNTPGHCIIEHPKDSQNVAAIMTISRALKEGGILCQTTNDIDGRKYSKLLVNLVNPINALSGMAVPIMLTHREYRLIWIAAIREATTVLRRTIGIHLPVLAISIVLPIFLSLPDCIFKYLIVPLIPAKEYKSSMLQDLERGRKTEVDDLCGEIVRLASTNAYHENGGQEAAPINSALVRLIHEAEGTIIKSSSSRETTETDRAANKGMPLDDLLVQVGLK